jgi:hypothetical protein
MSQDLLIAVLGGGNLILFAKFLIERHDAKKQRKEDKEEVGIEKRLERLEKDVFRTQLLLMILLRPEEQTEILTLGERYFKKPPEGLGGNWYMTSIFKKWCDEHELEPEWFESE